MTSPAFSCPACHAPLVAEAHFCHRCGRATNPSSGDRPAWIVAWLLVVVAVGGILFWVLRDQPTPQGTPDMANAPGASPAAGAPPDISQMSPTERFLRLHDRVMAAAERGDSTTVATFTPMALTAYGMLEQVDADLRYHAASLHLRVGDFPAALALADTILKSAPNHLLGLVIRAEAAQARGDQAAFRQSRDQFLRVYAAQLAAGRPEYTEHQAMLAEMKRQFDRR